MKAAAREAFRWSAHTGGQAVVKQKDYEDDGEVEAASEYAAWRDSQSSDRVLLLPGDLLERCDGTVAGELKILKYIGFEPAIWWAPLPKSLESDGITLNSLTEAGN